MADHEDRTPGDVASMVANPFYAINLDEGLALPHQPLISEDDWGKANVGLIEELGLEAYLRNLLSILKGNYPAADRSGSRSKRRTGTAHPVTIDRPQFPGAFSIERACRARSLLARWPLPSRCWLTSVSPPAGWRLALAGRRRCGCRARWPWIPMSAALRRTWRVSSS